MKKEDFERLKAVCEKEGFELLNVDHEDNEKYYVIAKKKDIWDGVEFVYNLVKKKHQKVCGRNSVGLEISGGGTLSYRNAQESTQQAYVEQLKKEAFERFGEIKEGDCFQMPNDGIDTHSISYNEFKYIRESDSFYLGYVKLYQQGKWATRVKERVKVDFDGGNLQSRQFYFIYGKDAESKMQEKGCFKVGEFLASQLEKYLNGEIE